MKPGENQNSVLLVIACMTEPARYLIRGNPEDPDVSDVSSPL